MQALQPTQDSSWVLTHEGYNVLTENAVESRFALGNGFLGMRASRPVSRGPTWVSWLGHIRWASTSSSCGLPSSTSFTRDQSATGTSAGTGGTVFGLSNRPAT